MKSAPGFIKGNIKANDNTKENYFLLLKKEDGSTTASVEIEIEELENVKKESNEEEMVVSPKPESKLFKFYNDYFYHIVFLLILVLAGYYIYNFTKDLKYKKVINLEESHHEPINPIISDKLHNYLETIDNE